MIAFVFDMATSTLAMGDVQIAARDGHEVPHGTGLGPDGKPSDDPAEILQGSFFHSVVTKAQRLPAC